MCIAYVHIYRSCNQTHLACRKLLHMSPRTLINGHVFVRNDGIPAQIRPPYSGLYKVLQKWEKYFVVDVNGKQNTISIDRLKKAIMEPDTAPPSSPPSTTHRSDITASAFPTSTSKSPQHPHTKSGRRVCWPAKYVQVFYIKKKKRKKNTPT
uniref:Uncharacterized protein n=1 Tax=Octopus bimaculoides TaxID=37653 RepID=A0A0L8G676_OCTBM